MVRNRKLAKAISDVGWGTFTNFLDYKLKEKGGYCGKSYKPKKPEDHLILLDLPF